MLSYRRSRMFIAVVTVSIAAVCSDRAFDAQAQAFVPVAYESVGKASSATPASAASIGYSRLGLGIAWPIALRSGRLVAGVRYDRVGFTYGEWPSALPAPDAVHHVRLELILQRPLSRDWEATVLVAPGWASDFTKAVHAGDANLGIAALLARTWSERVKAGFGVSYVTDRGPAMLPVVRVLWQRGRMSADLIAPSAANVWYRIMPAARVGFAWRGVALPYHLNATEAAGGEWTLRRQVFSLAPALRVHAAGSLYLHLEGGMTLRNRLVYLSGREKTTLDHDPSFFFWVGLVVE
ncbi:MAG: DUF6268 family outer membrane beta-barrel protein [Rhodothermales bacterium]